MLYQSQNRHLVREGVLHCAAVPGSWHKGKTLAQMVTEIKRWHTSPPNSWRDIGYHIICDPEGHCAFGRPLDLVGAHVAGANTGKLGILLIESQTITKIGKFSDYFTPEQRTAVLNIARAFSLKVLRGHNDFTSLKVCPGFHVEKEFTL